MLSLSSRIHPAAVVNGRKKRFLRVIAFGTASGAILSLIIGFGLAQVIKNKSVSPLIDFSFIFPIAVLLITIGILFALRYVMNNYTLTVSNNIINFKRFFSQGISIPLSEVEECIFKYIPGGTVLLVKTGNKQIQIDLTRVNSNEFMELLYKFNPEIFKVCYDLIQNWIDPLKLKDASSENLLRFYLQYGLDENASDMLSNLKNIDQIHLEKLYLLDRVNLDFLLMSEIIPSYLKFLKNRLPKEDFIRISIILHQKTDELISDSLNISPETIDNELLEKWKTTIKFRKYPVMPYGSIGSKIMQGTGNYLFLDKDKMLRWRDGSLDPVWITGYCASYGVLGISDVEIYDISGRRFTINREPFETLVMLRTHLPWAMELGKGSYLAAKTRLRRKRLFTLAEEEKMS